jgi:hypothetical protein
MAMMPWYSGCRPGHEYKEKKKKKKKKPFYCRISLQKMGLGGTLSYISYIVQRFTCSLVDKLLIHIFSSGLLPYLSEPGQDPWRCSDTWSWLSIRLCPTPHQHGPHQAVQNHSHLLAKKNKHTHPKKLTIKAARAARG